MQVDQKSRDVQSSFPVKRNQAAEGGKQTRRANLNICRRHFVRSLSASAVSWGVLPPNLVRQAYQSDGKGGALIQCAKRGQLMASFFPPLGPDQYGPL